MIERTVLWYDPRVGGAEHATVQTIATGRVLSGTVVSAIEGVPLTVEYAIRTDEAWRTREVDVRLRAGGEERCLRLEADGQGQWSSDGRRLTGLDGCIDIDLGVSPMTNTLPIRRLRLRPGDTADVDAAWVRFPDLALGPLMQTYQRLDVTHYRYLSGSGSWTLVVDDAGLVVDYEGCWRAVAVLES